jgi:predicted CopG family antitoxin
MAKVTKGISLRPEIYDKILSKARGENRNFSNYVECVLEKHVDSLEEEEKVPPKLKVGGGGR